jgi:type IV secretory pathway VirB4 component
MPVTAILALPLLLLGLAAVGAYLVGRFSPGSGDHLRERQAEQPLAHELPYWTFLSDGDAGVAVNVDLTYSSWIDLSGIDSDCLDGEALAQINGSLHSLYQQLGAGAVLQFLAWSDSDVTSTIERYRAQAATATPLGRQFLEAKADALLAAGGLRRNRLLLTVSARNPFQPAAARALGFVRKFPAFMPEHHEELLRELAVLRELVTASFRAQGLRAEPLSAISMRTIAYEFLNPVRALVVPDPFTSRWSWPSNELPRATPGAWADEQSAREQLAFSPLEERRDHIVLGGIRHRVVTLRSLPTWTEPAMLEPLLSELAFHARIAFAVEMLDSERVVSDLKRRLDRATILASTRARRNQEAEAQLEDIDHLIDETLRSTLRLTRVSLSVVLSVRDDLPDAGLVLERQTAAVLRVLHKLHGAQGLVDECAELDEFLATLPGNAKHGRRFRQCTSKNAAHLTPAWQARTGSPNPCLLLQNARGNLVGLDPFNPDLDNPNAFMAGSSGSGKSVTTNYLLLNLVASGCRALIVDEGGSYRRLLELFGGDYFALSRDGAKAFGVNPFFSHDELFGEPDEELRSQRERLLLSVLERMVHEEARPLANEERAVLRGGVKLTYERVEGRTPILSDLLEVLGTAPFDEPEDARHARGFSRQLRFWASGPAARLLNQPSGIRLTTGLAAFDLKGLDSDPHLKSVVMLILSGTIWNLVARDRRERKVVVFDEVWKHLQSPAGAKLVAELYRTSRKYACSILTISQSVDDFVSSPIAPALTQNSHTVYLLRHQLGHDLVAKTFRLNPREAHLFGSLEMRRGEYSEALVLHGDHHFLARIVLSPLEYWIATTHQPDLKLELAMRERYPHLPRLELLSLLADRFPLGAKSLEEAGHAA